MVSAPKSRTGMMLMRYGNAGYVPNVGMPAAHGYSQFSEGNQSAANLRRVRCDSASVPFGKPVHASSKAPTTTTVAATATAAPRSSSFWRLMAAVDPRAAPARRR